MNNISEILLNIIFRKYVFVSHGLKIIFCKIFIQQMIVKLYVKRLVVKNKVVLFLQSYLILLYFVIAIDCNVTKILMDGAIRGIVLMYQIRTNIDFFTCQVFEKYP